MAQNEANFARIAASSDETAEFRELNTQELSSHSFSDYFRFSLTVRMDRDEALAFAYKLEHIAATMLSRDARVYVGVSNHNEAGRREQSRQMN